MKLGLRLGGNWKEQTLRWDRESPFQRSKTSLSAPLSPGRPCHVLGRERQEGLYEVGTQRGRGGETREGGAGTLAETVSCLLRCA